MELYHGTYLLYTVMNIKATVSQKLLIVRVCGICIKVLPTPTHPYDLYMNNKGLSIRRHQTFSYK